MNSANSCLVDMEACVGARHASRQLLALGHDVKLIPGQFVKPFLKGEKNDFRNVEAVAEAVQRPTMCFVPTNSVDQLDLQALHRVHARLVSPRTATVSPIRAFLLERAIAVRQGLRFLRQYFPKGTDLAVHIHPCRPEISSGSVDATLVSFYTICSNR